MSRKQKSFRQRHSSAPMTSGLGAAQTKKTQSKAALRENERREARHSRRAILLLGAVVMLVFSVGALASWRGMSAASLLTSSNAPFNSSAAAPMPSPPTLPGSAPSKEFVYAGSALLATTEPFREPPTDLAVWRPSNGNWYVMNLQGQWTSYQFGVGSDTPVPADFDGDGKTDFCVFRVNNTTSPSSWTIFIIKSADSSFYSTGFGLASDVPAPADFDGDGKADITVWRPSDGNWYITRSTDNSLLTLQYGASGDKPVPADFDGDGIADAAVWRNTAAAFYGLKSSDGQLIGYAIGASGDVPVIGDYDGDGKADYAVRHTSDNTWLIHLSATDSLFNETWGVGSDIEVAGDYDHDGKTDIAVWRPGSGVWYIRRSTDGSMDTRQWGQMGDVPVPAPYRY